MQVLLCVCFIAAFVSSADGQGGADAICESVVDFAPCPGSTWTCDVEVSQCFCKSGTPYCRCNSYIDEFYLGKSCSQKWTTLTFILVATLPGVVLALVIGVTVHIIHTCCKSNKSHSAGHNLNRIPGQEMFPGVVGLNSCPAPGPTPMQVGVPMASTRPYSVSDNTQFVSGEALMGAPHPQYNAPKSTHPAFERPPQGPQYSHPPSPPTPVPERLGQQPYSYTGGGAQVLSNPYARARNPYEEHNTSAEPYSHHTSQFAYEEQRMAPPPGASEYRSALPRAQIGRPY
ncbi:uncharacterized protein zgc:158432 isoform X3 [Silurus meridionalis]|uniref:uncharacterized protein zgc:158432 isoform X3 n=1 Tax=Silurus meridionalis TaxID=175797 RepID=UPI001EEB59AC|nr:uncharacterized protein zgc:158432 isoform X3 [Silurus meridionalis]